MASSKIKLDDVSSANGTQKVSLPKYSSQVINLANGYAKATRPDNVGQVSEDIKDSEMMILCLDIQIKTGLIGIKIIILMVFKRLQMKHGQCL